MLTLIQKLSIIFLLLLLSQNSHSQNWVKIIPTFSSGDTLLDMSKGTFVTKDIGWIIVSNYNYPYEISTKIFKTTDGGYNWLLQKKVMNNASFNNLFAVDSIHLWALGIYGDIVFTTDGGATWDSSVVGNIGWDFRPMFFFNSQEGMVFNDYPWATTDGGKTWVLGDTSTIFPYATDVDFVNRKVGWIVGACNPWATDTGFIANTNDSGNTWKYQSQSGDSTNPYAPNIIWCRFCR